MRDEGESDEDEGGHGPIVLDRGPDRDIGAEGPPEDGLSARPRRPRRGRADRGHRVAYLVAAPAVGAGLRPHDTAEVEGEHGEPAVRGQLVAQRPQQRVVLATAVPRVRMADHRRPPRRALGHPELALQADAVFGGERHGSTAWTIGA